MALTLFINCLTSMVVWIGKWTCPPDVSKTCVCGHEGLFIRLNPRSRKMLTIRGPDRQFHSQVPASHMITDATELWTNSWAIAWCPITPVAAIIFLFDNLCLVYIFNFSLFKFYKLWLVEPLIFFFVLIWIRWIYTFVIILWLISVKVRSIISFERVLIF